MFIKRKHIIIFLVIRQMLKVPYQPSDVDLSLYFGPCPAPIEQKDIELDLIERLQRVIMTKEFLMNLRKDVGLIQYVQIFLFQKELVLTKEGIQFDVLERLEEQFSGKKPDINLEDKLFEDLKADSLDIVELLMDIEYSYGIAIPDHRANGIDTVQSIADLLYIIVQEKLAKTEVSETKSLENNLKELEEVRLTKEFLVNKKNKLKQNTNQPQD